MNYKLSIILPVFNEINTVATIINKLVNLRLYNNFKKEVIIIDDCSTDGSKNIIKKYAKKYNFIKTIYKKKNKGKGDSQKIAKKLVTGNYVIIQDADLEYRPSDINKLLKIALKQKKDFVIGYRNLKTSLTHPYFFFRETAVNILTGLMNVLYRTNIKDSACCYRLFSTKFWKSLDGNAEKFDDRCNKQSLNHCL
jgi:glycosyltransferase involved in cell wall biosynthesis